MDKVYLFLILFCSLTNSVQARTDTLILEDDHFIQMDLTPFASLYTDEEGSLSIDNLLKGTHLFRQEFEQKQETVFPTAHWLKIHIEAKEDIPERWLILKSDSRQNSFISFNSFVDVFYVKNGHLDAHHRTGYYVPQKEKSITERAAVNVIPFSMKAGEVQTVYIRISQVFKKYTTFIDLELRHPVPNISATGGKHSWVIYGSQAMYALIGCYVIFFWLLVKDRSYLYFGIFCIVFSIHYLNIEPSASFIDRFFPDAPQNARILTLIVPASYIFFLLFGRSFSEVKNRLPSWDKYLLGCLAVFILYYAYLLWESFQLPYAYNNSYGIILIFFLILPVSIKFLLGKHLFAKIFGAGIVIFFFWNSMGLLWNTGMIRIPFNPWPVGQISLLIIFGIGLAYKFFHSEREKVQAERIRELDRIKSRFFANISHEFRTPLSLILGPVNQAMESIPASESLTDENELPVKGKHLSLIRRNALRLQSLVDQLLDLSKLDNGKMILSVSEGNIIQFIRSIVFSFESLAERKHIHYHTSFPAELDNAFFDHDKLEKILVNLLSNAFKFTPEHGTIRVSVDQHKSNLKIQVSDSGSGMKPEEVDKIFDRFYQVEGTEAKGTGIGLALVKEIVNLHGGQISVDSIQGEGTNFKLILPYQKQYFPPETAFVGQHLDGASTHKFSAELAETLPVPNGSNRFTKELPLALVVEDNPDLRHYICENIQDQFQVIIAKDGQEGIDIATEQIPDIIISDVMMPKKTGFELCEQLKKDQRSSHIPIILLTARVGQEHKIEGLEQGADDYLTKPFDIRELNIRMANLIEQRQRLKEKFAGELQIRPTQVTLNSVDERFLKAVMQEIEKNLGNEFFTVEELARSVGFSRSQLHRKLKALTDKSANQLIREFRLTRAKDLLEQNSASVSEIAYQVGYSNLSYFSKSYKEAFGKLPSESGQVS